MDPSIRLLGNLALFDAEMHSMRMPTRKGWALLAYLVLSAGREIQREELAGLLWPRASDTQARASLRQELAVLRKALAATQAPAIHAGKEHVRFDCPPDLSDVTLIQTLVRRGATEDLRRGLEFYRGEFLAGLNLDAPGFEDWLLIERQRVKSMVLSAYAQLLDMDAAGEDAELAMATAQALLAIEPTQEQGHRALMRLYRRTGRRAEALKQFRICEDILHRELDAEPSQETIALANRIRADIGARRPAHVVGRAHPKGGTIVSHIKPLGPVPDHPQRCEMTIVCFGLAGVADLHPDCDPEDLAAAQDRFLFRAARVITAHGGAIVTGLGDRVVGCFGYPDSGPTDTERAIRTAVSVAREPVALTANASLWPRAGIARGTLVIRPSLAGSDGAGLAGAALHVATGFEQFARGGEIIVAGNIRGNGADAFEMNPVPMDRYGAARPRDPGLLLRTEAIA